MRDLVVRNISHLGYRVTTLSHLMSLAEQKRSVVYRAGNMYIRAPASWCIGWQGRVLFHLFRNPNMFVYRTKREISASRKEEEEKGT